VKKKERTPAKKIQRVFSQNFLFIFGASSKRGKNKYSLLPKIWPTGHPKTKKKVLRSPKKNFNPRG
jgi:hypothetical protein